MTTETEIAPLTILSKGGKGTMRCSSLRPGDYISNEWGRLGTVIANSYKMQRVAIQWGNGEHRPYDYAWMAQKYWDYRGHGQRRLWHAWLPKWLAKRICPFSKPKP